jgi:beta-N-acetylhexosaminidase
MAKRRLLFVLLLGLAVVVGGGTRGGVGGGIGGGTGGTRGGTSPPLRQGGQGEQVQDGQLARLYVSHMSLDEEIAQLLMVEYRYTTRYDSDLDVMLHEQHVGGVIMYREQINTVEQTIQDTTRMQKRSTLPVFIAVDEEGWNVSRLRNLYSGNPFYRKDADDIRATGDPRVASREGEKVAKDLLSLGINMDLAPDVDVSTENNYIGYDGRSFGSTPAEVIKYAGPYMKAMQAQGVIGCIKHFPGIGSLTRGNDPHMFLPTITESKRQLYQNDIASFAHFIQSTDPQERASVVMPTNVMVPSVDARYPAEFSHSFITDILRNELHFDGVILTDALVMGGVQVDSRPLTLAEAGVMALQAGDDMLMGIGNPTDVGAMISAIKAAIEDGTLTRARVDEAATRIIALKMAAHLMPAVAP